MGTPVGFNELFNFDDTTPLDQMIDKITRLNNAYDMLVQDATSKSTKYAAALNEVLDAAGKLETQMQSLDASEKAQQETIAKAAAGADKLVKENEVYIKSLKETEEAVKVLTDQQDKLRSAKEKMAEANKAEAGSIKDIRDQLSSAVTEYNKLGTATSQAVKDEQIKKITELSKTLNTAEVAVKQARKGTELLAGSYYELNSQVAAAKKRLKEMEGGIQGNSKEFKELQKFVTEGSEKLKEFDKTIGDNQRNVGNYESAFDSLDEHIGGVVAQVKHLGKELVLLAANPWFLVIAAIVGAFILAKEAVSKFYETTGEGQDIAEQNAAAWKQFIHVFTTAFVTVGKGISDFIESIGGIKTVINGIISFLHGWIRVVTFVPATLLGLGDDIDEFFDHIKKRFEETVDDAIQLTKEMQALSNLIIAGIIRNATAELQVNELLAKSRDKLHFSDEQRLAFLKEAVALDEQRSEREIALDKNKLALRLRQLALDQNIHDERNNFLEQEIDYSEEGLKLLQEQIKNSNLLTETKHEIAEGVAEIVNQESAHIQKERRNQQQIIALTLEIEQRKREASRRELDSRLAVNKFILEAEVKRNDLIVKDEDATLTERLTALNDAAQARVDSLEIDKQNELNIVQRAAEDRIRAEGKVVTAALLAADKGLQNQRELIGKKYVELIEDVNRETIEAVEHNVFTQLSEDAQELNDDTSTIFNEIGRQIENDFKAGNLTIGQLLRERGKLSKESARAQLENTIQSLEIERATLEKYGHDVSAIDAKLSAARLALSKQGNEDTLEGLKAIKDASIELAFQVFDTVGEILDASSERNIAYLEGKLDEETEAKDAALRIVGDDAQAREFIEVQSAERSKEIQRQINAEKRKAAIFDKAIAITQATAQTALGVARALGSAVPPLNFILAALVGAAGALQIASIAAAPIPAFWRGTDNSPEGYAWVAERGREAIISPSGDAEIAEGKQIRYLEKGSRVLDNATTESLLADAAKYGDGYLGDQLVDSFQSNTERLQGIRSGIDSARIVTALDGHTKQIVGAIQNQPQDFYDEKGYRHYETSLGARIHSLNKRYKLQ